MDPLTDPTPGPGAPPVFGFMHVATVGPWRPIVRELFAAVERSGLARRTRRLFLGVVGPEAADFAPPADYAEVAYRSAALGEFEFPTLGRLHRLCGEGPAHVYYCHTKGAWRDRPSVHAWRRYMQHFVIDRHADCIAALAEHDLCGVDWRTDPWPHFSGNFWWACSNASPDGQVATMTRLPCSNNTGQAAPGVCATSSTRIGSSAMRSAVRQCSTYCVVSASPVNAAARWSQRRSRSAPRS